MPNNSSQTNKSLDEILAELEQRFGSDSPSSSSTSSSPAPRKKKNSMSPNTIVGALVFTLLVVGVASAMWLGSRSQDLRQLAVYTGEPCSPNGITTCDAGTQYTCNAGEWQPTGTCTSPTSTPITCAGSSDSRCQGDAGGTTCDNINGINYVCQPGSGNNYNACTCERQDDQCSTPQVAPLVRDRECVADDNTTDQCVGLGKEGEPCQISDLCLGGTGTCRQIAGQGDGSRGNCTCVRGSGGPNPSPSVSPSPSLSPTPTPTPGGGGGGNTPTPTPVAGQCVSLTMTNLNGSTQPPRQGDSVTFTCGQVAGATRYEFRVLAPGSSTWTTLAPSSSGARVSVPFTFSQNGSFRAQCRPCTGTAASTCQAWEQ